MRMTQAKQRKMRELADAYAKAKSAEKKAAEGRPETRGQRQREQVEEGDYAFRRHQGRALMTRNRYRLRLEWFDGHTSFTVPVGNRRLADRQVRSFREVALMRAVTLEWQLEQPLAFNNAWKEV